MGRVPVISPFLAATPRKRLWVAGSIWAAFVLTLVVGNAFAAPSRGLTRADLGADFLAFYTAGTFVRDGHAGDLYDLAAVGRAEAATAAANGMGPAFGPWWNPPVYALALEPLAALPFRRAVNLWRWINVASVAVAALLLAGIVYRRETPDGRPGLRSAALVPLLIAISMPFIQAMSHGQNTGTSLLLLTATVVLWRRRSGLAAGLVGGLLFYKPQLAAVVAAVMAVDLGGAAVAGLACTGTALLLVTVLALPGSLTTWLHQLPANVHSIQVDRPYMWDRHVTLKAFWRLLVQGTVAGETRPVTAAVTAVTLTALAATLAWAAWRARGGSALRRDRLIVATVCGMPLLMPFYFDYDLLLLAVPATLYAADPDRDGRVTALWAALYIAMFVHVPVANATHVGVSTVLLTAIAVASARRATPVTAPTAAARPRPLAIA